MASKSEDVDVIILGQPERLLAGSALRQLCDLARSYCISATRAPEEIKNIATFLCYCASRSVPVTPSPTWAARLEEILVEEVEHQTK
jgi:hypothetical protein